MTKTKTKKKKVLQTQIIEHHVMKQNENYETETQLGKVEIGMKGGFLQELRVGLWGINSTILTTHFRNFGMLLKFRWPDLEPSERA